MREEPSDDGIDRRTFLKYSAAAGGLCAGATGMGAAQEGEGAGRGRGRGNGPGRFRSGEEVDEVRTVEITHPRGAPAA